MAYGFLKELQSANRIKVGVDNGTLSVPLHGETGQLHASTVKYTARDSYGMKLREVLFPPPFLMC